MAMARKCDRCGKFYTENTARVNGKQVYDMAFIGPAGSEYLYDLCDDCIEDLKRFLNMHESEEEE